MCWVLNLPGDHGTVLTVCLQTCRWPLNDPHWPAGYHLRFQFGSLPRVVLCATAVGLLNKREPKFLDGRPDRPPLTAALNRVLPMAYFFPFLLVFLLIWRFCACVSSPYCFSQMAPTPPSLLFLLAYILNNHTKSGIKTLFCSLRMQENFHSHTTYIII